MPMVNEQINNVMSLLKQLLHLKIKTVSSLAHSLVVYEVIHKNTIKAVKIANVLHSKLIRLALLKF